jgi:hypothetical protein
MQEPELLETLYVTQQMAPEAAELALETALRTLSSTITSSGTSSSAAAARQDSAVTSAISGLQEASHKYGQVRLAGVLYGSASIVRGKAISTCLPAGVARPCPFVILFG